MISVWMCFLLLLVCSENKAMAASKAPDELLNWRDIRKMKLLMEGRSRINETSTVSTVVIQRGTGRHELRWLQDPQIMEGERERMA